MGAAIEAATVPSMDRLCQHLEALAAEQTKLLAELTRQRAGMADIPYMGEINAIMDQVT